MELLVDHGLLIATDSNCRICNIHLNGDHLRHDLKVSRVFSKNICSLSEKEASLLLSELLDGIRNFRKKSCLNFDDESYLNDEDYEVWTGWTKAQFNTFLLHNLHH